ncbi:MFS transporter [Mesosutterella sp. AGMB02718]|uniref:MFS transporter n=1 Tax=Mesosutterella faecium TaxID=2925194 RepID=A0ABT7INU5_9BURK|nr:MFS transporter [Mesosutterella sp. AGMB02718]MDL2060058.1 MFS transporter [Mesosutterella sp. AGMB02718]
MSKTTFALIALASTFFGIGITEFIGVGILPEISEEFSVSTSTAGLIVSLYALGQGIGGILLTSLTSRQARKKVLLASIVLFIAGHVLTALAPTFFTLLAARIISAAAHGLFFSIASAAAVSMVPPSKAAGAVAFIFSGFTVATAFAAPLGTYISSLAGWRIPFFGIALVGVVALALNKLALPDDIRTSSNPPSARDQLRLVTHPHVLLMMAVTILGYGSTFAAFTYLSPLLTEVTGIDAPMVSAVLVLYGVTVAIGNTAGGRIGNGNQLHALFFIFIVQALVLAGLYFALPHTVPALAAVSLMGIMAFMSIPSLQSYILVLAKRNVPSAVDLASSLNIASFSLGITVGATLGGLVIDHAGLACTPLAAAGMAAAAVLLTVVSMKMEARELSAKGNPRACCSAAAAAEIAG